MADVYIFGNASPYCGEGTTDEVIDWRYDFMWYAVGSGMTYCEGAQRAVSIPVNATVASIKQTILDDMTAWATTNGHTILRRFFYDFTTPV